MVFIKTHHLSRREFVDTQQKLDADSAKKASIMFENLNASPIGFSCSYIFDETRNHENLAERCNEHSNKMILGITWLMKIRVLQ